MGFQIGVLTGSPDHPFPVIWERTYGVLPGTSMLPMRYHPAGKIPAAASPAERLHGNFQVFFKTNRIGDMPAVHTKPCLGPVQNVVIRLYYVVPGIGCGIVNVSPGTVWPGSVEARNHRNNPPCRSRIWSEIPYLHP